MMAGLILVVEDNDDDFFAISRVFGRAGVCNPVRRCSTGEQALDYLSGCSAGAEGQATVPGLILLDLNLPGVDGRRVLRSIKSDPGLRTIPVIVLTTSCAGDDVRRCYEAGADSYLFKPVDLEGLKQAVERLKGRGLAAFELALAGNA